MFGSFLITWPRRRRQLSLKMSTVCSFVLFVVVVVVVVFLFFSVCRFCSFETAQYGPYYVTSFFVQIMAVH